MRILRTVHFSTHCTTDQAHRALHTRNTTHSAHHNTPRILKTMDTARSTQCTLCAAHCVFYMLCVAHDALHIVHFVQCRLWTLHTAHCALGILHITYMRVHPGTHSPTNVKIHQTLG